MLQCLAYWDKIKGAERWGPEWSLQALAAAQRVQLSLSAFGDNIYSLVQPHADRFRSVYPATLVLTHLWLCQCMPGGFLHCVQLPYLQPHPQVLAVQLLWLMSALV